MSAGCEQQARFAAECVAKGDWHHAADQCPLREAALPLWITQKDGLSTTIWRTSSAKNKCSATEKPQLEGRKHGVKRVTDAVTALLTPAVNLPRPAPKEGGVAKTTFTPAGRQRASHSGLAAKLEPKPDWCGFCDEKTRQADIDGTLVKHAAPNCHPLASPNGHKPAGRHARQP